MMGTRTSDARGVWNCGQPYVISQAEIDLCRRTLLYRHRLVRLVPALVNTNIQSCENKLTKLTKATTNTPQGGTNWTAGNSLTQKRTIMEHRMPVFREDRRLQRLDADRSRLRSTSTYSNRPTKDWWDDKAVGSRVSFHMVDASLPWSANARSVRTGKKESICSKPHNIRWPCLIKQGRCTRICESCIPRVDYYRAVVSTRGRAADTTECLKDSHRWTIIPRQLTPNDPKTEGRTPW